MNNTTAEKVLNYSTSTDKHLLDLAAWRDWGSFFKALVNTEVKFWFWEFKE